MNARLNELHDALALIRLALVRATEADDPEIIAEIDRLTVAALNEVEQELAALAREI